MMQVIEMASGLPPWLSSISSILFLRSTPSPSSPSFALLPPLALALSFLFSPSSSSVTSPSVVLIDARLELDVSLDDRHQFSFPPAAMLHIAQVSMQGDLVVPWGDVGCYGVDAIGGESA